MDERIHRHVIKIFHQQALFLRLVHILLLSLVLTGNGFLVNHEFERALKKGENTQL